MGSRESIVCFYQSALRLCVQLLCVACIGSWKEAFMVSALTVKNLTQHVPWPVGSENNVRLAKGARLHHDATAQSLSSGSSPIKVLSLEVTSNFTSDAWTPCPFKNRTCSSLVEPYARILACTRNTTQPLLDASVLQPTDAALLNKLASRNDTNVLFLTNGKYVDLNETLTLGSKPIDSGQMSIISWIWLASKSGQGDVKILSKVTPASQGGLEIYSVITVSNGNLLRLTYSSGGGLGTRNFIQFSLTGTIRLSRPAWHHLAVIVDGQSFARAYLDGVQLTSDNQHAQSPSIFDSPGILRLGGKPNFATALDDVRLAGTQLLNRALSSDEIDCLSGCLERFQVNANHFNPTLIATSRLTVAQSASGLQLVASGAASLSLYEKLLQSLEFVSNEPQPDPSPRSISISLHLPCSSSTTWLEVVQTCQSLNHTCHGNFSSSHSECIRLNRDQHQCLSRAQLTAEAVSHISVTCTTMATAGSVISTTVKQHETSSGPSTSLDQLGSSNSANGSVFVTSRASAGSGNNNDVIPGLPVGSSVAVILCIVIVVLAVALAALIAARQQRKRKMMLQQNSTRRRRYQYRPYAAARPGVQLQRKSRVSSLNRTGSLPPATERKKSMFDDIGMLPEDLQADPRQEVRDMNESFFNPQLITPMMFTRPSIVPLSNPTRVRNLLPAEFDDDKGKKNTFTVTTNVAALPEMTTGEEDYPESGMGASQNSLRSAAVLSRSRDDLTEEMAAHVGLDDQVLALARTGRRKSVSKPQITTVTPGKPAYNADLSLSDFHLKSNWRTVI